MASNPQRWEGGLGQPWEGAAWRKPGPQILASVTERKQVSFQPPSPGSGHREPRRGLPGAGVWVRTPRFARDPSSDSHVEGTECILHAGHQEKDI